MPADRARSGSDVRPLCLHHQENDGDSKNSEGHGREIKTCYCATRGLGGMYLLALHATLVGERERDFGVTPEVDHARLQATRVGLREARMRQHERVVRDTRDGASHSGDTWKKL